MKKNKGGIWKADVYVTLKPSVQDPQGDTVLRALKQMHYVGAQRVRMGKFIELWWDGKMSKKAVEKKTHEVCDRLLANPNIEAYHFILRKMTSNEMKVAK